MNPVLSWNQWHAVENAIKHTAQQELIPRFTHVSHQRKADGSIITEADFAVQNALQAWLKNTYPDYGFIGEEMGQEEQLHALRQPGAYWILDPLDGTSNFAYGIPFFSVSLALVVNGKIHAGCVYDPTRDECFSAVWQAGAKLNGQTLDLTTGQFPSKLPSCNAIIDFKRLSAPLRHSIIGSLPYASQRSYGSVALDWSWLAAGRGHIYLHGNQKIWDYAAGWLILHEAKGISQNLKGEAVPNFTQLHQSAVAAVNPELFDLWRQWLTQAQQSPKA